MQQRQVYWQKQLIIYALPLVKKSGKEIMTNEFGQYNDSPELMTSLMESFKSLHFKYAVVFSGDNVNKAASLSNGKYLTPVGESFRNELGNF